MDEISLQKEQVKKGNPKIDLVRPCSLNDGILPLPLETAQQYKINFDQYKSKVSICFFTPASGSGSRMFKDFYEALNSPELAEKLADKLSQELPTLGIFTLLSPQDRKAIEAGVFDTASIIRRFIDPNELSLAELPKGLIPFHIKASEILTAFQEHAIQSLELGGYKRRLHFTVNANFKNQIQQNLADRSLLTPEVSFSVQEASTDAYCFDDKFETVKTKEQVPLRRPSGHGALLRNLNAVDADVIFIRNIDNIQHSSKNAAALTYRGALAGIALDLQNEIFNVLRAIDQNRFNPSDLEQISKKYAIDLSQATTIEDIKSSLNRPIRACGMVKNEGQPGGGPFWVRNGEYLSPQIVEKSQISNDPEQLNIMENSTHFNPVELVCCVKDYNGNKFDLEKFRDDDQYFLVNKTQGELPIQYIEQPGLWNGSMANWLTIFVEIPSACFSPVKTIFDLNHPLHREG